MIRFAGCVLAAALSCATASAQPETGKLTWADILPYDFGPAGKVVSQRDIPDIGVTFLTFANGLRVTVKPIPKPEDDPWKDIVHVSVRFGFGQLELPKTRIDGAHGGLNLFSWGGLGKLAEPELGERIWAAGGCSKGVMTAYYDAFQITAIVDPRQRNRTPGEVGAGKDLRCDIALEFAIAAARFTDPGWDSAHFQRQARSGGGYPAHRPFYNEINVLLHSGDERFIWHDATPDWKVADALAYMKPIVETAPIDVIVVGDTTVEEVVAAMAPTLGALPPRPERPEPPGLRTAKFPAAPKKPVVVVDRTSQYAFWQMACPTQGIWEDIGAYRLSKLMNTVLQTRLRAQLPSEDWRVQAMARNEFDIVLEGYGTQLVSMPTKAVTIQAAEAMALGEIARLKTTRISDEDLIAAKAAMVKADEGEAASPDSWIWKLAGADRDPRRIAYLQTLTKGYDAFTAGDVQAAAQRWFKLDKCFRFRIEPEKR